MTQALMDYVTARHDTIVAVLEMLTAEHRLSDEDSSVLALTGAECEVDAAAARLAAAADALPHDRRPVGWSEPPAVAGVIHVARTWLVKAALRCLSAQYADESACADAEAEYAEDRLCLAARNLAADAEARTARRAS
jgi:hypothetical protein